MKCINHSVLISNVNICFYINMKAMNFSEMIISYYFYKIFLNRLEQSKYLRTTSKLFDSIFGLFSFPKCRSKNK